MSKKPSVQSEYHGKKDRLEITIKRAGLKKKEQHRSAASPYEGKQPLIRINSDPFPARFAKLYPMNARPLQKRDRRFILSSGPR